MMNNKLKTRNVCSALLLAFIVSFSTQIQAQDGPEEMPFPSISYSWYQLVGSCTEIHVIPETQFWCGSGVKTYTWTMNGVPITLGLGGTIDLSLYSAPYNLCVSATCSDFFEFPVGPSCQTIEISEDCCELTSYVPTIYETTGDGYDCRFNFCIQGIDDLEEKVEEGTYCIEWFRNGYPIGYPNSPWPWCRDLSFKYLDGPQEICAKIYCCENPEIFVEACMIFEADCNENLECDEINWDLLTYRVVELDCMTFLFYEYDGSLIEMNDFICWSMTGHVGDFAGHDHWSDGFHVYTLNEFSCGNIVHQTQEFYCCDDPDNRYIKEFDFNLSCSDGIPTFDLVMTSDIQDIIANPCTRKFEMVSEGVAETSLCYDWSVDGGPWLSTLENSAEYVKHFECEESGEHTLCARVYCCQTGEVYYEECIDFQVDCPCCGPVPTYTMDVTAYGQCSFNLKLTWMFAPIGYDPNNVCFEWYVDGNLLSWATAEELSVTFHDGGEHVVCVRVLCCEENTEYMTFCETFNCLGEWEPKSANEAPNAEKPQEENLKGKVTVYPNPTNGILNWSFENHDGGVYQLQIFNGMGQMVFSEQHSSSAGQVTINDLSPGWYVFNVVKDGEVLSESILVK